MLVVGGFAYWLTYSPRIESGSPEDTAEIYDPTTGTWTLTSGPNVKRDQHSATLLPDGRVP